MHEAHQDPQNENHNHWFCMCVSIVNTHMALKKNWFKFSKQKIMKASWNLSFNEKFVRILNLKVGLGHR